MMMHVAMQVVAVAVERFVTVCLPFQQCNMSNGLGYILPIVAFSLLYNVVKFFEIETIYIEADEWVLDQNGTNTSVTVTYPWLSPTDLRKDPEYSKYVVFILNFIVMGKPCLRHNCRGFLSESFLQCHHNLSCPTTRMRKSLLLLCPLCHKNLGHFPYMQRRCAC